MKNFATYVFFCIIIVTIYIIYASKADKRNEELYEKNKETLELDIQIRKKQLSVLENIGTGFEFKENKEKTEIKKPVNKKATNKKA